MLSRRTESVGCIEGCVEFKQYASNHANVFASSRPVWRGNVQHLQSLTLASTDSPPVLYSGTRFALYDIFKEALAPSSPAEAAEQSLANVLRSIAAASTAGFLAGIVGNPADLANVRMQNDSTLPAAQRRNYRNVFDAWRRMAGEPGGFLRNSMRGVFANSTRAAIMTASQLAAYDAFKDALTKSVGMGDNLATHFTSSILAGLVATTLCSPVDVLKTQIMKSSETKPIMQMVRENFALEGPKWMFRGWVPSFTRLGPQTVATFMILEQHKKLWRYWKGVQ